jgi:hypothetical protein
MNFGGMIIFGEIKGDFGGKGDFSVLSFKFLERQVPGRGGEII